MREASHGSSPKYSKLRPLSGVRMMFTPGPSMMCLPRALASCPMVAPNSRASAGSHVAARHPFVGMNVTKSSVRPAGFQVSGPTSSRTPCGPSDIHLLASPKRGNAAVVNFESPWHSATFSSTVIWERTASTRAPREGS